MTINKHEDARRNDQDAKLKQKAYADRKAMATGSEIKVDDRVYLDGKINVKLPNKAMPRFNMNEPLSVIERKGSMVTASNGEHEITRNVSFFKKIEGENETGGEIARQVEAETIDDKGTRLVEEQRQEEVCEKDLRRSTRDKKEIKRLGIND